MEIVKIDAQKLQLLNDRINQTIDALNQVRLSTHGLQHSSGQIGAPQWGLSQVGLQQPGVPSGFYGQGLSGQGFAGQGFAGQGFAGQGFAGQEIPQTGLQHSGPGIDPSMRQVAFNSAGAPLGFAPTIAPGGFAPMIAQGPQAFGTRSMGISHTAPVMDPYWQQRAQMQVGYPQQYSAPQVMPY